MSNELPLAEKRKSTLRRDLNESVRAPDGTFSEAKAWSNVGKLLCAWLIVGYTEMVLKTEYTLFTLLLFLIAPDLIKKFLVLRLGGAEKKE